VGAGTETETETETERQIKPSFLNTISEWISSFPTVYINII
jgi:hypothetical protein